MAENRSVLIVEDDAAMLDLLVCLLEEEGMSVWAAGDVKEALDLARALHFDAVVSDIRMPHQDGFQLLAELQVLDPEIPVILMTAFGTSRLLTEALEAGAFDYLPKPFKRVQLLAALERAFER